MFVFVLFVIGYQVAEGFSAIQDGLNKCFHKNPNGSLFNLTMIFDLAN